MTCIFPHDNNVEIKLIEYKYSEIFCDRSNAEPQFRRIITYLINNRFIVNNFIDLGAYIGDNSIPWAANINGVVYAIDPCHENIEYIEKMSRENNILNIKTIKCAISDKNETLFTNDDLHHCSFRPAGENRADAVSLDFLHDISLIDNIGFIHLDVEGFEQRVMNGSLNIISKFRPVIAFEQHLTVDNYLQLSDQLIQEEYDVYLISEILEKCLTDCRNLIAFPKELNVDIDKIHENLGIICLLKIGRDFEENNQQFVGDSREIIYNDSYIFARHDDNRTLVTETDLFGDIQKDLFMVGIVNIGTVKNILNVYKNICQILNL